MQHRESSELHIDFSVLQDYIPLPLISPPLRITAKSADQYSIDKRMLACLITHMGLCHYMWQLTKWLLIACYLIPTCNWLRDRHYPINGHASSPLNTHLQPIVKSKSGHGLPSPKYALFMSFTTCGELYMCVTQRAVIMLISDPCTVYRFILGKLILLANGVFMFYV